MTADAPKRATLVPLLVIAILLTAVLAVPRLLRGPATIPDVFQPASLDAAITRGHNEHRPVLVLVTSDSCSACERLKRTTLTDDDVNAYLADNFIPVNINETAAPEDAVRLPYQYLPTTLVINDGTVVARLEGYRPAPDYLAWLRGVNDAISVPHDNASAEASKQPTDTAP